MTAPRIWSFGVSAVEEATGTTPSGGYGFSSVGVDDGTNSILVFVTGSDDPKHSRLCTWSPGDSTLTEVYAFENEEGSSPYTFRLCRASFGGTPPPLRQRQRNDGARRRTIANPPTSRQFGPRLGQKNTYY